MARRLWDVLEIMRVKARYFRFLDHGQWGDLRQLLADNVVTTIGSRSPISGADALVSTARRQAPEGGFAHHGHMPDVELLDDTHARGVWAFMVSTTGGGRVPVAAARESAGAFPSHGYYTDEFVKVAGRWMISSIQLTFL